MKLGHYDIHSNTFGVEIEYVGADVSQQAIATALRSAGVDAEVQGYNHRVQNCWKLITDASCGYEIVSPILRGEDGFEQIRKVCAVLNRFNARVNRSTGLHVHIGFADATLKQFKNLLKTFAKYEEGIDMLMPPSRRANNNRYCASLCNRSTFDTDEETAAKVNAYFRSVDSCRNLDDVRSMTSNRFVKLNTQSYWRYGTIEVRHHSGTTDADKIINWVRLSGALVEMARNARCVGKRTVKGYTPRVYLRRFFNKVIQGDVRRFYGQRYRDLVRVNGEPTTGRRV